MFRYLLGAGLVLLINFSVIGEIVINTSSFRIRLDDRGYIFSFYDLNQQQEYLSPTIPAPLLSIRTNEGLLSPIKAEFRKDLLILSYSHHSITAVVELVKHTSYLKFTLKEITNQDQIEVVIWGPFPTTLQETIGECVGVVRNKSFALGIQSLNPKTLGGYPSEESDIEPSFNIFAQKDPADLSPNQPVERLYRGQTAKWMPFGSVLQAYTRHRHRVRNIAQWEHDRYVALPFDDGGVHGSSIVLFGCPPGEVLKTISTIELQEGLPHPLIQGEWAKTSRQATASYLIADFGLHNLDSALALTKKAGLKYLYHGDPFETWGHFILKPGLFPENWASLKTCVDRAEEQGIHLGLHTLSNFITPNDAYVSPVPDGRLAKVGTAILMQDVTAEATEIQISEAGFFNQMKNNTLRAVVLGSEIIRYRDVSPSAPWQLSGCVRGAFKTKASAHPKGGVIGKLMDHPYQVFLSEASLSTEIAQNLARLFNATGLRQTSFDGLEGTWSSGMGQYARILFTKTWYDHLSPSLKGQVINDASNPAHYNWHINTRYNWGEPWYAGFRESQLQYRLMNQDFYRRNYLPAMLGWFSMSSKTTVEDVEWLLARAAGFDAGFAFNLSLANVTKNGQHEAIFKAINTWESARMAGLFTPEQKQKLANIDQEFHLEKISDQHWTLWPVTFQTFTHIQSLKQPGEPAYSINEFAHAGPPQPLQFQLQQVINDQHPGGRVEKITLALNQQDILEIPVDLEQDQILVLETPGLLKIFTSTWQVLRQYPLPAAVPQVLSGLNTLQFSVKLTTDEKAQLKLIVKLTGEPEQIVQK